jgi:tetratricopeptide (TPR) repeat protein
MAATPKAARDLFLGALERTPAERAAYLDGACAGDAALRQRVEALLRAHDEPGQFLSEAKPEGAGGAGTPAPADPGDTATYRPGAAAAGAVVAGRYKLLQPIGEGGMGAVWLAEQTEPVRRRVAVKLIRAERGESKAILARFEAERQAIALMDHPHIARLLDAGTTDAGAPFFVMELVKGVPITEFCDAHRLSVPERLTLFTQVCAAVQHAHTKGVIHRDLKPSNVLVESHDGRPVPKVIDFGLAKAATGLQLTEHTLFTAFGSVLGTPLYMAPEQARFNAVDVDTRADVYALGVILYELLTGTTPLTREAVKRAALDEVLRLVREQEAPTPSSRLSAPGGAPSVAANRQTEPARLGRLVRGELDWIVLKALAKERDRRYETASGFARDVERFLAHEPVAAGPPSAWYRFRKFARRHRGAVAAVAVILVLVAGGIVGTAAGLVRALRAERRAAEQRGRAQENLRLALQGLDAIYLQVAEDRLPRDPRRQKEDAEVLRKALDFYERFARQNADEPPARLEVVRAYRRAGDIRQFVGEHAAAQQAYGQALAAARTLAAEFPGEPAYSYELALCCARRAEALLASGQLPGAAEHFGEAVGLLTRLSAADPAAADYRAELARGRHGLGKLLKQKGERPAAEEQLRRALDIQGQLANEFPAEPRYRFDLAETHQTAGYWLEAGNLYDAPGGVEHVRTAQRLLSQLVAQFPEAPLYRYRLAITLQRLATFAGDFALGIEYYQQAIGLFSQLAADYPQVPDYRSELGACYTNFGSVDSPTGGDSDRATNCRRQSLDLFSKLAAEFPTQARYREGLAVALSNWAHVSVSRGELAEARKALEESLGHERAFLQKYPNSSRHAAITLINEYLLAGTAEALGAGEEAARLRQDADQLFEKTWKRLRTAEGPARTGNFCADIARGLQGTGSTWGNVGNKREMAALCAAALKAYGQALELDPNNAVAYYQRGLLYAHLGRPGEAAADYARAIERDPKGPAAAQARRGRAAAYQAARQYEKALADCDELLKADPRSAWEYLRRAGVYAEAGRPGEAAADYARAIERDPKGPAAAQARRGRAAMYQGARQYEKALADYDEWLKAEPKSAEAHLGRAGLYAELRRHGEAAADYARAIEVDPKGPAAAQARRGRAAAYQAARQYERALADCEEWLKADPRSAEAYYQRGLVYAQMGRHGEAAADFSRVIELDPKGPDAAQARRGRADAYQAARQYEKAVAAYGELLKADPGSAEAYYQRGLLYAQLGRHGEAAADFSRAIEPDPKGPGVPQARRGRAAAYQAARQYEKALADCDELLKADPGSAWEYLRRAGVYAEAGRHGEAAADYARAIELDPNGPAGRTARQRRDLAYQGARQYDKALADYGELLKADPKSAETHNNLAWLLATCPDARWRDPARAVELARKAVGLAEKSAYAWNTLGVAQYRAGDWPAAAEALRKSVELSGGGESTDWLFLAMAYWRLGKKDEARQWYDKAAQWMEKNKADDELRGFRAEADALLGGKKD